MALEFKYELSQAGSDGENGEKMVKNAIFKMAARVMGEKVNFFICGWILMYVSSFYSY